MPKLLRITTVPISLSGLLKDQLKFMRENGFEVLGVSSPGAELQEVKHSQQVETVAIPMTRTISPLKDLKALWQLYLLFKKEKPDIVHTHTPKAGTLGMMAAKLAKVPIRLHTIAGLPLLEATGAKRKLLDRVEKITYACATKVYPNSYGLYNIVIENKYTQAHKLKVIAYGSSNGIDTSAFNPSKVSEKTRQDLRKELGISEDDYVYLFVGRVVTDKGVNELVQAFSGLEQESNTGKKHLVIVGNYENHLDPLLAETEKEIKENPYIHAVGFQDQVINYFALADVLTFPSYREGFPNVVMQAAAMQLPAIVTNINGCNEIITHQENGWIIPVKNADKLREYMQWCFENQEEAKKMGLNSRKLMQDKFEREFVWQELLKEYQSLLGV